MATIANNNRLMPHWRLNYLRKNRVPQRCHRKIITMKHAQDSFAALLAKHSDKEKLVYLARRVARMNWCEIGSAMNISHTHAKRLWIKTLQTLEHDVLV